MKNLKVNWKLVLMFIALTASLMIIFSCKKEDKKNYASPHADTVRVKIEVVDWNSNPSSFNCELSSYSPSNTSIQYSASNVGFMYSGYDNILDTTFVYLESDDLLDKEFFVYGNFSNSGPGALIRYKIYFNDELKEVFESNEHVNRFFSFN